VKEFVILVCTIRFVFTINVNKQPLFFPLFVKSNLFVLNRFNIFHSVPIQFSIIKISNLKGYFQNFVIK